MTARRALALLLSGWCLACGGLDAAPAPDGGAPTPDGGAPAPDGERVLGPTAPTPPRPVFPLTVGDRWTWQITQHTWAGLRVLFIPTEPARDAVVATWTLTVDGRRDDGRFAATLTRTAADALPAETALTLWDQGGELWSVGPDGPERALELSVPPDPVATEHVPCVAHFLDHVPGSCSPAPGGPLGVPPGPTTAVVSQEPDRGRGLAQVLVGIATAGLLIPGNRAATEVAELTGYTTARPPTRSPAVEAFRARPTPDAVGRRGAVPADREDAAAFVALAEPGDRVAVAGLVAAALPVPERPSIARVALGATEDEAGPLPALAALVPALGGPPDADRAASLLALLPEPDREPGRALLEGRWPVLLAALRPEADPVAAVRAAAAASPPSSEEAEAVVARAADPGAMVGVLAPHVAPGRRLPLLREALAGAGTDGERSALLAERRALLVEHRAETDAIGALLATFDFDDGRVEAATALLREVPAADRGPLLRVAVVAMGFDDGRLALLSAFPAEARALSPADRDAVLGSFAFEREAAERLVSPGG